VSDAILQLSVFTAVKAYYGELFTPTKCRERKNSAPKRKRATCPHSFPIPGCQGTTLR